MKKLVMNGLPLVALLLSAGMADATLLTECPAVGTETGCAWAITVGSTGNITIVRGTMSNGTTNQPGYDSVLNAPDADDAMVALINDWTGHTITGIAITGAGTFDFSADAGHQDNPCSTAFTRGEPHATGCGSSARGATRWPAPDSYAGPGVTNITPINVNTGLVTFTGVTAGNSVWFGLEGPVKGTFELISKPSATPEPARFGLVAAGLLGAGLLRKRRRP